MPGEKFVAIGCRRVAHVLVGVLVLVVRRWSISVELTSVEIEIEMAGFTIK